VSSLEKKTIYTIIATAPSSDHRGRLYVSRVAVAYHTGTHGTH